MDKLREFKGADAPLSPGYVNALAPPMISLSYFRLDSKNQSRKEKADIAGQGPGHDFLLQLSLHLVKGKIFGEQKLEEASLLQFNTASRLSILLIIQLI